MEVNVVDLSAVKPYHRNPRINDETIDVLKESIVKFGFRVPLVVDDNGVIVTGHARYKACLGLKGTLDEKIEELKSIGKVKLAENLSLINEGKVFIVRGDDLSHRELQEFRISDNKIHELSKWENDMLKFELRELDGVIGFDVNELSNFISDEDGLTDFDKVDFDSLEGKMVTHFERLNDKKDSQMVSFSCPYCGKGLSLDKSYILSMKPKEYYEGDGNEK